MTFKNSSERITFSPVLSSFADVDMWLLAQIIPQKANNMS